MAGLMSSIQGGQAARQVASTIFDLAPVGIEICNAQGQTLETNAKCHEIFGATDVEGIKGDNLFAAPELSPESRATLRRGQAISYEALFDFDAAKATRRSETTRTGKIYLSVLIEPVLDLPNRPISNYIVLYQDITERRLADLALRDSEERFRKVFEDGVLGMVIVDRQFQFTRANPTFCSFVGYSEAELQRLTFKDITHPEHLTDDIVNVNKVLAGELSVYKTEKRYVRKDGSVVWGAANISVIRDDRGEFLYFLTMVEDITQGKHAEEKLTQANERLALATSSGQLGVWDWNIEDNTMIWNDRMLAFYGITREQFADNVDAWTNRLHPDDKQRMLDECQQALDGVKEWNTEFRTLHPSGQVFHIKARGAVIRNGQGKPVRMIGINADITERKQAERELSINQARTTAILNGIADTFYSLDTAWRFTTINPAAEKAPFGRPAKKMLGKVIWDLFPGLVETRIYQHYLDAAQKCCLEHYEAQSPLNQRWYEVFMQGWSGGVDVYMRDITDRKKVEEEREKLQAQLFQAQKMESVGRLAGGVAHDFNNMLGVILGHIELAEDQIESFSPVVSNLEEIHKAATRSADLTRQLLTFARKQTITPKVLDLNETVEGMLKMLHRMVGENIELCWTPGEGVAQVYMDPSQIHQILANLCINARDAIKDVGRIHVTTSRIHVDQSPQEAPIDGVPGDYVMLTVSDDGCGMDRATIDQLFEPFFTTKELGRGTGLGLSTVHGIVKQNSGHICVQSEVGRGSTFRIYLPAHHHQSSAPSSPIEAIPVLGGRETILLVEDEESLLQMSRRLLEGLGYTVLPAKGPGQAIRLAKKHGSAIHLLLTDVVMPEMSGRELASALQPLFPKLKCLFISGYTADFFAKKGVLDEGITFLQKPFARDELSKTVRCLLDGRV